VLDDVGERSLRHTLELASVGGVDEIEECRKGVAEAEAAPAAVTDIEDALELRVERGLVVEIFGLPVERVPGRGVEAAFACGLGNPGRARLRPAGSSIRRACRGPS
jgi:hypothetical protein